MSARAILGRFVLVYVTVYGCSQAVRRDRRTIEVRNKVSHELLVKGHFGNPSNWPMYGGDYSQRRYSPLEQINRENVEQLALVWKFSTGSVGPMESTPIVVGDALYITTPMDSTDTQYVIRLESTSGKERWRTALHQDRAVYCCGPNNRGVAVYKDRVFVLTMDASLVSVSATTGEVMWRTQTADPTRGYSQTHAPLVYDGKVFVGSSGGEFSIRGFVKAFDAESGRQLWTWHTIPSPEEGGWWGDWIEVLPGTNLSLRRDIRRERSDSARYADSWRYGGGPVWMTPSLDPATGTLFVGIGNPTPNSPHPGDRRWSSSVCALRAANGSLVWCYQYVPHDRWDYDAASPPFLFELGDSLTSRRVVGHFSKIGFFYMWDRRTGQLITRSNNYVPQINLLGDVRRGPVAPGMLGGVTWSPGAYSPQTGYVYATTIHMPMPTPFEALDEIWGQLVAVHPLSGEVVWRYRTDYPMIGGVLTTAGGLVFAGRTEGSFGAWDAATGTLLWDFPTGVGCNAAPATFTSSGGKQFVVVACGGNHALNTLGLTPLGDQLLAFAFPG